MDKLDPEQTITLLEASNLLETYSSRQCTLQVRKPKSRKEAEEEEEQAYSDILCALQLLVNLSRGPVNESSSNVRDVIFFGLQQMLPLMMQGLLSYPILCTNYFWLVGCMMESYPERVSILPYNLLDVLFQSLLFGASHHDSDVAKRCLEGMEGLVKAHLKMAVLCNNLEQHPDLLDWCTYQILRGIVFQQLIIWDWLDATLNTLLVLVAAEVSRFASVATELGQLTATPEQQNHLQKAFEKLVQPEVIASALQEGHEGTANRKRFRDNVEAFVYEVNSFLVFH
jgi:hypothetical protein